MRALIASSATGGHIYPALAIAEEIKRREPAAEILFVGAKWEIGADIVRNAGYNQVFIDVRGFDRQNPFRNISVLMSLARASGDIKKILSEFKPDVCIGTGGHVAGPVIRAAFKAGIRTIIQEQNVMPGVANKLAEPYAGRVFVGFEEAVSFFKNPGNVVVSGNPVRAAFAEAAERRAELREKYGVPEGAFCVLFFGGSQGADAINEAAVDVVRELGGQAGYYFIVITGRRGLPRGSEDETSGNVVVMEYADEIYELYAAADLLVTRAGGLTMAEITQSGKASILIPSPNVTGNHQYYNAKALADAGAAVLLDESEMRGAGQKEPSLLSGEIERLRGDWDAVRAMGEAAKGLAKPEAAKVIADELFGR